MIVNGIQSKWDGIDKMGKRLVLITPLIVASILLASGCAGNRTLTGADASNAFTTELSIQSATPSGTTPVSDSNTPSSEPTAAVSTVTAISSIPSTPTQSPTTTATPTTTIAPTTSTAPTTTVIPSISPTAAASTTPPTSTSPNGLTAAYLDFSFEDDPAVGGLTFYIKLSDINYGLLAINGNISIKIWDQPDASVDVTHNPVIQHWDNVPVTRKDFVTGVGFEVAVKYQNFTPDVGQSVYITLTFTADKINLASAQTITINKSGCCS